MANTDVLHAMVEPIVASLDARIYDLEFAGGVFRLTIDRPGGIDLESIAEATRQISRQLDHDDPIPGRFTLEVTSPGLERNLRTPAHWSSAVGETVRVKMVPSFDGDRRFEGSVVDAGEHSATIAVGGEARICRFDEVDRARTVFIWGPTPKPGTSQQRSAQPGAAKAKGVTAVGGDPSDTEIEGDAGDADAHLGTDTRHESEVS